MKLEDLFTVVSGHGLDFNKMTVIKDRTDTNYVNFVSRKGTNQGIVDRVKRIPSIEPSPVGAISVGLGESLLSSYVQQWPFYTAEHMRVLTPKRDMTLQEKLFYCICIKRNAFKYSTQGREPDRTFHLLELPDKAPDRVNDPKTIAVFREKINNALW